jgi:hypothetical protein
MAHHDNNENLSPEEKKFRELIQNGDDFMKIEIYRSALSRYREAAKLDIDNELANQKVAECERLIRSEENVISILLAVAAVVFFLIWLF